MKFLRSAISQAAVAIYFIFFFSFFPAKLHYKLYKARRGRRGASSIRQISAHAQFLLHSPPLNGSMTLQAVVVVVAVAYRHNQHQQHRMQST